MEIAFTILLIVFGVSLFFNILNFDKSIDLEISQLYSDFRNQQNIKLHKEKAELRNELLNVKKQLKESISNRELKSKRINELMYESKQWESKLNKALSYWQKDRNDKYKALIENKKLISRNAELQQQNDALSKLTYCHIIEIEPKKAKKAKTKKK